MAKIKYHFNPDSLTFHKIELGFHDFLKKFVKQFSLSFILGTAIFLVAFYLVDSPQDRILKRANNELLNKFEILNKNISFTEQLVDEIKSKDNDMYRPVFEANIIPNSIRQAGIGGSNQYEKFSGLSNSSVLVETSKKVDVISRELFIQSKSFDELAKLISNKEKMMASMPALPPIKQSALTGFGPFGMRFHPILHYWRMHKGVDLVCPKGTKAVASGDGTVVTCTYNGGLGYYIVINHGFGFETWYGHLSKILVHEGQKVKRGETIALVGTTGLSMTPHLHYEVHRRGAAVDPLNFYYNDLSAKDYDRLLQISTEKSFSNFD